MSYTDAEAAILARFSEKCRIAGGPKAGYVLRKRSIEYGWNDERRAAAAEGLGALVEKGLLASSEAGDRFILTEQGAQTLIGEGR